jgi:hypothetical protein
VTSNKICGGQSSAGTGFPLEIFGFPLLIIIPPLLHTHPSPPHEVCSSPEQVAHYPTLGPKGFISDLALDWSWNKVFF